MSQDTQFEKSRLLRDLHADSTAITQRVTARIEHDDIDYGTPVLGHDELVALVADCCAAWLDALAEVPYSREPARRAGRLKAERGIPLESLLHAFRVAGLVFWEIIVESAGDGDRATLPRLSTLVWATVDNYSVAAADAYRRVVAAGTAQPGQGMLRALLDPGLPPGQRAELGRRMGLSTRAVSVVLVGDVHLDATGVVTASTVFGDELVTLVAAGSPATLERALRTVRARAGASRPFTDLADAPTALDEARFALRCAGPAETGVHTYASAPERALIAANPELAADVFAELLAAFDRLDREDSRLLIDTALAWYDLGGSSTAVGKRLHLHRNTVRHRLERIERLTGKTFASPADAALLYLALHTRLLRAPCSRSDPVSAPPRGGSRVD
ncbi:PucR family transcriptional regulator [Nocardia speluncae]|uniref:PucR family transcriptional regulator n=1 Tax=Nocardia speluncae TaxID=419477 RepID=A0A846X9X4_9NOCA|nr:helix-turn-helix domain-containing protein [Nocardia speluncae]NKY31620.1 PucR family transcriptional regulator [Nocardia speluncae]